MEEKRIEIIEHYLKRGMTEEYWNEVIPKDPAEVERIYAEIQKELEISKRLGKRFLPPIGGLRVYETYYLDEEELTGSDE